MKKAHIIFAACMGLSVSTSAIDASPTDDVIRQLQKQGYSEIRMSKTWLGRARIVAETRSHSREIIINPSTGEVLRDFVDGGATAIREVGQKTAQVPSKGNSSGNDNSGGNGNDNSGGNGGGNSGGNGGGNSGGNGGGNSGGNGGGNSGGNGGGNSGGNGGGNGNGKGG